MTAMNLSESTLQVSTAFFISFFIWLAVRRDSIIHHELERAHSLKDAHGKTPEDFYIRCVLAKVWEELVIFFIGVFPVMMYLYGSK